MKLLSPIPTNVPQKVKNLKKLSCTSLDKEKTLFFQPVDLFKANFAN